MYKCPLPPTAGVPQSPQLRGGEAPASFWAPPCLRLASGTQPLNVALCEYSNSEEAKVVQLPSCKCRAPASARQPPANSRSKGPGNQTEEGKWGRGTWRGRGVAFGKWLALWISTSFWGGMKQPLISRASFPLMSWKRYNWRAFQRSNQQINGFIPLLCFYL